MTSKPRSIWAAKPEPEKPCVPVNQMSSLEGMDTTPFPVVYTTEGFSSQPLKCARTDGAKGKCVGGLVQAWARYGDEELTATAKRVKVIVAVTAHYSCTTPNTVRITSRNPQDVELEYPNKPPDADSIVFTPNGNPELAQRLSVLLKEGGFNVELDKKRKIDHGAYVPIKIMLPYGRFSIIQVSLLAGNDPDEHIRLGIVLSQLREETGFGGNVMFLCSGLTYSNPIGYGSGVAGALSKPFNKGSEIAMAAEQYVGTTLTSNVESRETNKYRMRKIANYRGDCESFNKCHAFPKEYRYMMPLMVAVGLTHGKPGKYWWQGEVKSIQQSMMIWPWNNSDSAAIKEGVIDMQTTSSADPLGDLDEVVGA